MFNLLCLLGNPLAPVSILGSLHLKGGYADQLGSVVRIGELTSEDKEIPSLAPMLFRVTHRPNPLVGHPLPSSYKLTALKGSG